MGRHVHKLTGIDPVTKTAACAECGIVRIKRKYSGQLCGGFRQARWNRSGIKRKSYRRRLDTCCKRCGFIALDPIQLDIHHIDGNHGNNSLDNLQTLCANCHRLVTYRSNQVPVST